jgi:uncharacterized protein YcbK (DUF882 family)
MGDLSPHFSRAEFACHCGCGFSTPNQALVDRLEEIRFMAGRPVTILSGCRCQHHNEKVGGAKHSQHVLGNAADIRIAGVAPETVAEFAAKVLRGHGGIGIYHSFTHVDVRPGSLARWRG